MYEATTGCVCESCSCGTLPAEFVRVRYYFGQRLGVMELSDQALYHAGKMAFHNARLHGFGVVCGLKVEKQKPPAGTKSTVLRVSTGAAIDPCGREVVIGIDQCIDVAAWFAKNRSRPELANWDGRSPLILRVAVRYRECPSDPGAAPRDPCGCDNAGCEFGRVRESFELALFTQDEKVCASVPFPPTDALLAAFHGSASGGSDDPATALTKALDTLVASGCPAPSDDLWLCLASFELTFDGNGVPVDVSDPDNTIPERRTLLPTNALQAMLLEFAAGSAAAGLLGRGPQFGELQFTPTAADGGALTVPIKLAKDSTSADVELNPTTWDDTYVRLQKLEPTGWTNVSPTAVTSPPVTPASIMVSVDSGLSGPNSYLLAIDPPFDEPIVDKLGRPLRPGRFVRVFALVMDPGGSGNLVLAPSL